MRIQKFILLAFFPLILIAGGVSAAIVPPSSDPFGIGYRRYSTLASALSAVKSGDTLSLLKDFEYAGSVDFASKPPFTFSMIGFDWTIGGAFKIGDFYSTSKPGHNCRVYIGGDAVLQLSSQFMQSGTNSTLIIDNGTLRSSIERYSFYFGYSRDGETRHPVHDNKVIFRGDHPRLEMTGADGIVYFMNDTLLRFELPTNGVYAAPPISARNITLRDDTHFEFANLEQLRKNLADYIDITLIEGSNVEWSASCYTAFADSLPDGVKLVSTNPRVTVRISPSNAFGVGGRPYSSLPSALAAIKEGDVLKMFGDVEYTGTVNLGSKPAFTWDFNGYNLTVNGYFVNGESTDPCVDPSKAKTFIIPEDSTFTINGQFMLTGEGHTMDLAGTIRAKNKSGYSFYWGYVAHNNTNALGKVIYAGVPRSNTFIFRGDHPQIITPDSTDCWIMYSRVIYDLDGKRAPYRGQPLQSASKTCGLVDGCSAEFRGFEALQDSLSTNVVLRLVESDLKWSNSFHPVRDGTVSTLPDGCQLLLSQDGFRWELHVGPRYKDRNGLVDNLRLGSWDFHPSYGDSLVIGDNAFYEVLGQFMATGTNQTLVISNGTMQIDSRYAFYLGHYASNRVEQSSDCRLVFRGKAPQINCTNEFSDLYIRQSSVIFDLPPEGYSQPVARSHNSIVIEAETTKFIFEGVDRIRRYYRERGFLTKDFLLMESKAVRMPVDVAGLKDGDSIWRSEDGRRLYLHVQIVTPLAITFSSGAPVFRTVNEWSGSGMSAWTNRLLHIKNLKVDQSGISATVIGNDSQFYNPTTLFITSGVYYVSFRIRVPKGFGGNAQFFWQFSDTIMNETDSVHFPLSDDGEWHDYRMRVNWLAGRWIKLLRLDFPAEFASGVDVEVACAAIERKKSALIASAAAASGLRFDLKAPPGIGYGTISWVSDIQGEGFYYFTTAPDGENHTYFFTPGDTILNRISYWQGDILDLRITQLGEDMSISRFAFVSSRPSIPADPVITSALPGEAIPRAGRPFPLEVVVRNYGTEPAEEVAIDFEGLPDGASLISVTNYLSNTNLAATAKIADDVILGTDGVESVGPNRDMVDGLICERRYIFTFTDFGAGTHEFQVVLKAKGIPARRYGVTVEVKDSLNLSPLEYPAPPKPVDTGAYEVGAFLFPGWVGHDWHAIWSRAHWRKPVLGWYDESNPETIDWQIKHLVENGISFGFVDWYWAGGKVTGLSHWVKSFARAKYRGYLKWALNWCNHFEPENHTVEDMVKVTNYWIDNYFNDPQYLYRDGRPVVIIWDATVMEKGRDWHGGCSNLLAVAQNIAKERGYKNGIYFIARGGDREDGSYFKMFADYGFDHFCSYVYLGSIAGLKAGEDGQRRSYEWIAETSYRHWCAQAANSPIPCMPSLSTGWDSRPWSGEEGWEVYGKTTNAFYRICADARRFADESGNKFILMGPMDEWGEGEIGYPNHEHGFGMLEAVRDTFGIKASDGWPTNYCPEDVGLKCPQLK